MSDEHQGHLLTFSPFSPLIFSALLYLNGDFEGGEFIFTEMDAKTVTVSRLPRDFVSFLQTSFIVNLSPASAASPGLSEASVWQDGGFLLWRGEPTRGEGRHQWAEVCCGALVHPGPAVQRAGKVVASCFILLLFH